MWQPRTWSDVEALIGHAEETASLDFKKDLGSSTEIAKDLAAMSINGGVIVYGVSEDKPSGVASEITLISIKQVEERLQQIAGSTIAPALEIEVIVLKKPGSNDLGVVAVVVPPSPLVPHQANHRYPSRRGTTTEYLEERDVERLYQQRSGLVDVPAPGVLLDQDFVARLPPGQTSGFGYLDLLVRPVSKTAAHPGGAWQRQPLNDAVRGAGSRQSQRLAGFARVESLNWLSAWEPWGAGGWCAGGFPEEQSFFFPAAGYGAVLAYPARLSFQARWSLDVPDERRQQKLYRSAREVTVAAELSGMLSVAGEYFMGVPGAAIVYAALRLRGFDGAVSESATRNRPEVRVTDRGAPDGVIRDLQVSALQLRDRPEEAAEELIERWLPAFSAGSNVMGPLRAPYHRA